MAFIKKSIYLFVSGGKCLNDFKEKISFDVISFPRGLFEFQPPYMLLGAYQVSSCSLPPILPVRAFFRCRRIFCSVFSKKLFLSFLSLFLIHVLLSDKGKDNYSTSIPRFSFLGDLHIQKKKRNKWRSVSHHPFTFLFVLRYTCKMILKIKRW